MAGFKTHITTSSVLGVGYTGLGISMGLPIESSLIAGGMCGIGGMLPDIDSDSGVPFRESMGFAAAIIPALLLSRFRDLGLNFEHMVLVCSTIYLFVRFGVARLLARYTVHRGMFHSIPAALTFAGVAFLLSDYADLNLRYFKAAGLLLGVMSHLILDEIYAVEWKGGRWRFKKSFGTAMKLWGKNAWANISTYGKLIIVGLMILGEPMVMERYGHRYEEFSQFAIKRDQWRLPGSDRSSADSAQAQASQPAYALNGSEGVAPPYDQNAYAPNLAPPAWTPNQTQPAPVEPAYPQRNQTIYDTYDTARRYLQGWGGDGPHAEPQGTQR
ncbi:MAG: metal-dependent hydrolase [Planctomycetota bacterium]